MRLKPFPRPSSFPVAAAALASAVLAAAAPAAGQPAPQPAFPVSIEVRADRTIGDIIPIWRFFGCDEPNYAESLNGRKLMAELGELRSSGVYFRAHNLLNTGNGKASLKWGSTNAYREDAQGRPYYNWTLLDDIFDSYYEKNVRPYVEVGFMPEALSTHPEPYRRPWKQGEPAGDIVAGWAYPPKDYRKWEELTYQWANHCVERYGRFEVDTWFWEVWNEANGAYWKGSAEDYLKLHDYAVAGIRRALPTAIIGGPDAAGAGGAFTRAFIEHCLHGTNYATGRTGTPLDFLSFHAKGSPSFVAGHVRMGISQQLRTVDEGFGLISSYPEVRHKPIILGEADPDGCAACTGPQFGYRNSTLYAAYAAESIAREGELAQRRGVNLQGSLTWAYEFEDQPLFAPLRSLATDGIDKPVLNVFRMFAKLGGRRAAVQSSAGKTVEEIVARGVRGEPDVSALAALQPHQLGILVWHYGDDDLPGPAAAVTLSIQGLPPSVTLVKLEHYRVDDDHGNSFTAWQRMGSPARPTAEQHKQLEEAGRLAFYPAPPILDVEDGATNLTFDLPRQAVSLLVLRWQ